VDRDLTIAGPNSDLAGLTVRLSDKTGMPDFGPTPGNYSPTNYPSAEPPIVAILPAPAPWRQDPDPTTTITPPKPRGKSRRKLLIAAVAVLVGAAVGVLVPTLLNRSDNQAGQSPTSQRTAPTTTTATTEPSTPSQAPPPATGGDDPAFAPTLNPVEDRGDNVTLTWSDPTNGNAQFVVVDVTNTERKALVNVAPGTTTYTVEDLDPGADQYCFQIIGIGLDDPTVQHGASASVCTNR
jgi:hypothetical protein